VGVGILEARALGGHQRIINPTMLKRGEVRRRSIEKIGKKELLGDHACNMGGGRTLPVE